MLLALWLDYSCPILDRAQGYALAVRHIAVIDDDEDFRLSLEALLDSYGYRVTVFGGAAEFLSGQEVGHFDCLISDIQMPGQNGLQLASQLRANRGELPIILLSAYATQDVRRRAMALGVRCIMSKPLDVEKLLKCISDLTS